MDEPENNLNPTYQKLLLRWIKNKFENTVNQYIIYSTHSPFMILESYYDSTLVVERNIENQNDTIIKKFEKQKIKEYQIDCLIKIMKLDI
ncbi:MAG: ATP-binding protein [Mycoplasma sp.]|nr:ATP-binding protein [Mycoplasma sp.]